MVGEKVPLEKTSIKFCTKLRQLLLPTPFKLRPSGAVFIQSSLYFTKVILEH